MEALSLNRQIFEIRDEFYDEAAIFKLNRSPIERQIALNHINALLDAYLNIKLDMVPLTSANGEFDGA